MRMRTSINLIVCQKSKIDDWIDHFKLNYNTETYDLTAKEDFKRFMFVANEDRSDNLDPRQHVGIINYDLVFRRRDLLDLTNFTLTLDESSLISNPTAKRTKFIHRLNPSNVILLSGTPTGGKYERLWPQLKLLGWDISKKLFYDQYVVTEWIEDNSGFKIPVIVGYKNVDRLKKKLEQYGCHFLKTEDVFDLPQMIDVPTTVKSTKQYYRFMKQSYVTFDDMELIGNTTLIKRMYARQLCGQYNKDKLEAFRDLVDSTEDRLIVFYNFKEELERMKQFIDKPISYVNGETKDLNAYEKYDNSITFIQYQAGAMGLNLQKANKIVYFTLPQSSDLFEQSKKRIHRIGQTKTCFYYYLLCKNTVEQDILRTLKERKDYDDKLFQRFST